MLDVTIRRGATLAVLTALLLGLVGTASAQGRVTKQIETKLEQAMENYDLLDIDAAKKQLNEAIILAKKNNLDSDPVMAKVHLHLGIVNFAGFKDAEAAKLNFIDAVRLDPNIQIGVGYKTAEMEALLDEARAEFGGGGGGGDVVEPADEIDCASLQGVAHTLVDSARAGSDKDISAYVAPDLGAAKVALHFRPQGAADFTEVKMVQSGDCKFTGTIPGDVLSGSFLHYYVAAHNEGGKVIASKGSTGSPNIIEISGGVSSTGDGENPLEDENPLAGGGGGSGGEISGGTTVGPKEAKVFLSVALGTGGGYVSGETEQQLNEVGCCFAPALLHLFPEIGYYLSPKASISAAFRMGFPLGANIPGHATAAPGVLLRYRQSLGDDGTGLQVNGAIGGGILRHTVKLTNAADGMDTDTVASGPLFIGGGAGWVKALGGPIKFVLESNVLAAIPVISELGTCPEDPNQTEAGCVRTNFALQVDVNMGLIFSF